MPPLARDPVRSPVNIAILGRGLVNWGGGIDLLRTLLNGVCATPRDGKAIFLLLPQENWRYRTFLRLSQVRDTVSGLLSERGRRTTARTRHTDAELKALFAPYEGSVTICFFPDTARGLLAALREIRADVVFPCTTSPGRNFPIPWIGYIFDFQHRYLPHLFTRLERYYRQVMFKALLRDARTIVVNSRAVKADALAFYPQTRATLLALPFSPSVRPAWLRTDPLETGKRFGLPAKYFIVCNQFWVHKDHKTAFRAFARFRALAPHDEQPIELVCTGAMHDHRAPAYNDEIKDLLAKLEISQNVHLLGHIGKVEQIALVRGAIAVIQPTRFEGGPGGGSIYDAVALGVPGLVSDIPVNREIDDPNIRYFTPGAPEELAQLMIEALSWPRLQLDDAALISRSNARLERLGAVFDDAVVVALGAKSA